METEAMRKELHQVIDNSDERLLQKMYDVMKEYDQIPEDRMRLIMQEREDYLNGERANHTVGKRQKRLCETANHEYDFRYRT